MTTPTEHFRVEELADGVYAAVATAGGFGLCNAGIVDLGGVSLVFDAMLTPQAGEALGRTAERLTHRPVGLLVNSHYHGDHVRGSSAVGAVHVVSTRRVRELVLERGPVHLRSDLETVGADLARLRSGELKVDKVTREVFEGWFEGILATPPHLAFRPPDLTIDSEMTIHGSRRTVRVITFGGGHSPSDVLAYLPDERIAFLGDLLFVGFHPSMTDGNPQEWVRILGEVRALGIDRAVPGHGRVAGEAAVPELERYISVLLEAARKAHARGASRDDLAGTPPAPPFDTWAFSPFYEENARFVYDWTGSQDRAGRT
jgi:glyoxylase-like metal-dependent hydrolase (beta-lactamase superfamily II)